MIALRAAAAAFLLVPPAIAPAQSAASAQGRPHCVAPASAARDAWRRDHLWRYASAEDADCAYVLLYRSQTPWPSWHSPSYRYLPAGTRFQMAFSPGQPPERPGAFGTFDPIPDVRYVRQALAVKEAWKPKIDRVVTFEVLEPLPVDAGTVGPQIDGVRYLPGGGSQFQILVPGAVRIAYLKVVDVRPIQ